MSPECLCPEPADRELTPTKVVRSAFNEGARMAETLDPIDDGIWRWTARHPEWHPSGFGDEVACFAVKTDAELLLIDPLLPADPAPVHELVDTEAGEHGIAVLVTIPYHVRDAERLRRKHGSCC